LKEWVVFWTLQIITLTRVWLISPVRNIIKKEWNLKPSVCISGGLSPALKALSFVTQLSDFIKEVGIEWNEWPRDASTGVGSCFLDQIQAGDIQMAYHISRTLVNTTLLSMSADNVVQRYPIRTVVPLLFYPAHIGYFEQLGPSFNELPQFDIFRIFFRT
jgi:hypothetical protein